MSSFPFAPLDGLSQSIHQEIRPYSGAPLISREFIFRSISKQDIGWVVQVLEMNNEEDELVCWEGGYRVGKPLDELSEKIPDYNAAAFSERMASLIRAGYVHLTGLHLSKENTFELRISDPQRGFRDFVIDLNRKLSGVSAIAFEFLADLGPKSCVNGCAPDILTKPMIRSSPTPEISSIPTSPTQYKILQEELVRSKATIARYQQSIAESSGMVASAGIDSRTRKPLKRAQQLVAHPHSKRSRALPPPSSSSARSNPSSKSSQQVFQPFDTDTSEDIDIEVDSSRAIGSSRKRASRVKREEDENLSSAIYTSRSHVIKTSRALPKASHPAFDSAGSSADDSDTIFGKPAQTSSKILTPSVKRPCFDETKRTKSMEARKIKPGASDDSCTEGSDSEQTIPTSSLLIPTQTSDFDPQSIAQTSDKVLLSSAEHSRLDSDTDLDI
ncbi:hypothetical protein [Phaffia rhodozyma]|uniref:Uncharacterized protein n=1 Tax=Phaffia rhodozyma TaxID=264483 RepID=A0A0F7SQP1_PHARH|nr:hypothetical protein [Phaffia rhodozyma]